MRATAVGVVKVLALMTTLYAFVKTEGQSGMLHMYEITLYEQRW